LINFRLLILQNNNIGFNKTLLINYTKTIHYIVGGMKIIDYDIKGKIG